VTVNPLPNDSDSATSRREFASFEAVEAVTAAVVIAEMLSWASEFGPATIGDDF